MALDAEKLRQELREIGDRRVALDLAREKLARDTRKAVAKAKRARDIITMGEVASLIGLDRTSAYQTYGAGK